MDGPLALGTDNSTTKRGLSMSSLPEKFTKLKMSVGGNREVFQYEDTFGMPKEEQAHITRPNRANTRIISELEFAIKLSKLRNGEFDLLLDKTLDFLLAAMDADGVLTNRVCLQAEEMLAPMERVAKEYEVILVGHAHIDMNWMWSYNETVAATLATFHTVLDIMNQYPDFRFSQSQAAVYKIVEEFDPEMMEEIKARIAEGRWEVTATAWVEPDKNMPNTESMLRHIQYTREYLTDVWGAKDFEVDFVPDTFGHHANVPEIDTFGGVKYFYHCRGLSEEYVLYRYRAPSGNEVLAYREPNWYNGAITPHIGASLLDILDHCGGLKTGLTVYGVGDHGGGPTRRDVERALEMMQWRIYPRLHFGTMHEFFHKAEQVREKLPVVEHEVNYFAPGCYTTQSRIKRGNRRLEASFADTEALSAMANYWNGFLPASEKMREAWRDVLFTHFHDILTGSCVQDSREHAMGLYQHSSAVSGSQAQKALGSICDAIDTSSVEVDLDAYDSQSEGAGCGYGLAWFRGVPSPERGSGKVRIFHLFNTLTEERCQVTEITVWDWVGDLRRIQVKDFLGNAVPFQLVDHELQKYWDHQYFRILVDTSVPALGYTTITLSQMEAEEYLVYLQTRERVSQFYDDYVLDNGIIRAVIDSRSGRLTSLIDISSGKEMIADGESAGLQFVQTEAMTSKAGQIGRTISEFPVAKCVQLKKMTDGPLRIQINASYQVASSKVDVVYTLDRHSNAVKVDLNIDWHEIGAETIPVLTYRLPVAYEVDSYQYDIPAGVVRRGETHNDVPGLQYGMAIPMNGASGAMLACDSKYGYRGEKNSLTLTLINSSTSPDPYPERGIQQVAVYVGVSDCKSKRAGDTATGYMHPVLYQTGYRHPGKFPMRNSFASVVSDGIIVSGVSVCRDGAYSVRVYEASGSLSKGKLVFNKLIRKASATNLLGEEQEAGLRVSGEKVEFQVPAYRLLEIKLYF